MASEPVQKRRRGRPKGAIKAVEVRLAEVIHFRVTQPQYDDLCRRALLARMGLNEYLRDLLQRVLRPPGITRV